MENKSLNYIFIAVGAAILGSVITVQLIDAREWPGKKRKQQQQQQQQSASTLVNRHGETVNHRREHGTSDAVLGTEQKFVEPRSFYELIGKTPMVDLSHHVQNVHGKTVKLVAKCEFLQPGFSVKDRIVRHIIDTAEQEGRLKPDMCVVAASSGNTGAATAMICAMRGYRCLITTSPKCSQEKMDAIRAYGAQLLVSPSGLSSSDPRHYMNMAKRIVLSNPAEFFDVDQYDSKYNPDAHYKTLGPEIWDQTKGQVTHFVAAASTGGTISGVGRFLKEKSDDRVIVVLADPKGSIFHTFFHEKKVTKMGKFLVEGVGKGSIPGAMSFDILDDCVQGSDSDAFNTCRLLAETDGILTGGSGGFNVFGAISVANNLTTDGYVVTIFPDSGIKYLSKVYSDQYLKENKITISRPSRRRANRIQQAKETAASMAAEHDFNLVGGSSEEDDDDDDDDADADDDDDDDDDDNNNNHDGGANGDVSADADHEEDASSETSANSITGKTKKKKSPSIASSRRQSTPDTSTHIKQAVSAAVEEARQRNNDGDRASMLVSKGGTSRLGSERFYTKKDGPKK